MRQKGIDIIHYDSSASGPIFSCKGQHPGEWEHQVVERGGPRVVIMNDGLSSELLNKHNGRKCINSMGLSKNVPKIVINSSVVFKILVQV